MQNKLLLSICIPTYNREKYLKECLDSIINQEWFNENEIEIVISDNASTDNTTNLVKTYQEKYKNIVYHRNEKNLGSAKNILSIPFKANWKYVWWFWDDDLMSPIWIQKTIDAIKEYSVDILLSHRSDFVDWSIPNKFINNQKWLDIFHWIYEFSTFLSGTIKKWRCAELFTFISIMCFKKDFFENNFNEINIKYSPKYINYVYSKHYFWHWLMLYALWKQDPVIWIYKEITLTYCRMWTQQWNMWFKILKDLSDVFIKFYTNHKKINKKILLTFSKIIISWIFPACVWILKPYINKKIFEFMKKIYLKL